MQGRRAWRCILALLLAMLAVAQPGHAGPGAESGVESEIGPKGRTLASRHALIVAIGLYGRGLPVLPTARDLEHARAFARAFAVPEDQIHILRDREAGPDAIRRAASELALRLAPSDQVLLYFSGLGSHRADLDRPGVCEETFITADGTPLGHGELAVHFVAVAERAEKTLAVFDSCSVRAGEPAGLAQRCIPPDPTQSCSPRANTRWRDFITELRKAAVPTANVAGLQTGLTGVAESASGAGFGAALQSCIDGVQDRDRSGALTLDELAACVRTRLASQVKQPGAAPLAGNRRYALQASGQTGGATAALFEEIHAGRDGRREVVLSLAKRAGGGQAISLRASGVGYLYLFAAEPGGFRLLFPQAGQGDNRLRAGEHFIWPREGAPVTLDGGSAVLALVADNARDLALLPGDGVIAADAAGRALMYRFATTSVRAATAPCRQSGPARNLSLARGCSDAYGAGLLILGSS